MGARKKSKSRERVRRGLIEERAWKRRAQQRAREQVMQDLLPSIVDMQELLPYDDTSTVGNASEPVKARTGARPQTLERE